ncbi:MAG: hypothetical protein ABIM89_15670, partial [Mycobacteriales bacterium]
MPRSRLAHTVALFAACALIACGNGDPAAPAAEPVPSATLSSSGAESPQPAAAASTPAPTAQEEERGYGGEPEIQRPPAITVRYGDKSVSVEPHTFCYRNACVDGVPPDKPVDIGAAENVTIEFPLDGWSFEATFRAAGKGFCGIGQPATVESTGDHLFALKPAGHAGVYDVTLFGRGEGDVIAAIRWTTTTEGELVKPAARLALLADHDGQVDS